MSISYYGLFSFEHWQFYIAATNEGLCFVGSMPASVEECLNWLAAHYPDHSAEKNEVELRPYVEAFQSYLSGQSRSIDVPVVQNGTDFQKKIWQSLAAIPYGETVTYGQLAEKNGLSPKAARSVGTAIGKNPLLIVFPCHRVVPKSSAPKKFRGGLDMKAQLLKLEKEHKSQGTRKF
ncbi:methylated-DNA--[protein]-cysteine S-methyltransferase [Alkalibacterium pelagium]|jgi:methylated-DNA-[protein]-cysteine S-methyltransferase|uniref:methylated-DNA--[protein]-cysteine S-methyltransferase n=1 Tax=Alkalibacterium pelagium TaxID=426702 RepID=A0A1H7IN50_9LACT|nr:methylated-DNA--[protein]-cysteine S-methyltransferase [Alkalibacterium pelagium]GEN50134.1 methylated-DNA--protein-cysteine methyltransferase, inducible [Alkalibacterium pelagium]SEK63312.1 methylated-DNA-[protein]-cysteine S-methyltransferase [Alkalibacterium pelagium]